MEHMRRLADITRESNYALWNALLTVEGMFAGVFSAVAIFSTVPKILSFLIVLTAILSAGLLIFNFRTTRNIYMFMGELGRDPENIERLSEAEKRKQVENANLSNKCWKFREGISLALLGVQSILILTLLYLKK